MVRGEVRARAPRRRYVAGFLAATVGVAMHVALPARTAQAAAGACTVNGVLNFTTPVPKLPSASTSTGPSVNMTLTSTLISCQGQLPSGTTLTNLNVQGTPTANCAFAEGVVYTTLGFSNDPPTSVNQVVSHLVGNIVAGGFDVVMETTPSPTLAGAGEFVVTSPLAEDACLTGATLSSVNVTGVFEFFDN